MPVFRNKITAPCSVCHKMVREQKGWTEGPQDTGPRWVTKCQPCSGHADPTGQKSKIAVTLVNGKALFKPDGYLNEHFDTYRNCCDGAVYSPELKGNLAPLDKAGRVLEALQAANFTVEVSPDLASNFQAFTAQTKLNIEAAGERATKADEELRSRGLHLFPFQRSGVSWLASKYGAVLADDMGLGKTIQALISLPERVPVLVVCPAVAKGVWAREAAKWRPDLRVTVLKGKGSFKFPEAGEMVILNYDILPAMPWFNLKAATKLMEALPSPPVPEECPTPGIYAVVKSMKNLDARCELIRKAFYSQLRMGTVVIADEAQTLKSSRTNRTKSFRDITKVVRENEGRTWLLTATPLMNKPQELWNVFQAAGIAQEAFGSWRKFVDYFNGHQDSWGGYEWGTPDPAVGDVIKRVMLRRLKVDVLSELPAKTWQEVRMDLRDQDTKAIESILGIKRRTQWERLIEDDYERVAALTPEQTNAIEQAVTMAFDMQGSAFEEMSKARAILARAKIPTMLNLIESFEEQEEPLVVFSAHRTPIDVLEKREGWGVLTGSTKPEDRTKIVTDFQAGKLKGLGATIRAGGVSITLTRAHQALFVDREWTPALNSQAEDRISRIGQTRGCIITDIVSNHYLDSRVHRALIAKQKLISNSVNAACQIEVQVEVPEMDFEALAKEARAEAEALDRIRAEAQREAQERAAHYSEQDRIRAEEAAQRAAQRAQRAKDGKALTRAKDRGWVEAANHPERRNAETEQERWALRALQILTDLDPDRANNRNDVGFNKADGSIGHWLNTEVSRGFTPKQWHLAINLCRKYHRQVGQCPPPL